MGQSYDCLGDGVKPCKIDHTLRINCRHCRLKKCLRAGMVRDLVQAKREVKTDQKNSRNSRNSSQSEESFPQIPQMQEISQVPESSGQNYFDQYPSTSQKPSTDVIFYSENEWDYCQPSPKSRKMTESEENLMGMEELQQFIQVPDDFPILEDSRSRMTSFSESSAYLSGIEEEERLFALAALYTDQVINLNMRRRITYTDHLLGSVFDGPCVCIVLFRTAAAVDVLLDQAYYSQVLFPNDAVLVTANGEYLAMEPIPKIENQRDSGNFESDEDFDKFSRQRDDIFRTLLLICDEEGHSDALLRASDILLAVGIVMAEVHEMVTSYIEITVYDVLDDPILKDMLRFQY
ncbi:Protein CBR-NHR-79 [Caenorhabditis briggsae]|uniref:Protein CBR-NHR-79 n=1 Tax=Caenorhabditis briggsae TaxID=6238 RepID=A8XY15_CAEBR|nr:Protein CBR-NHR-79 [Caenorhabditis briggsae]CAP37534.2 Protein CBR-NHR-79 [Caenorhabditis briggsae]